MQAAAIGFSLSLALAGCSSGGGDKPAASSGNGQTANTGAANGDKAAPKEAPVKLKIVYETTPAKDLSAVQDAINKYLLPKLNATVEIQQIDWGQWNDKVNLMIASREPVDVLFTAQWDGYSTNVAKGAYLALDDDNLTVGGKKVGNLLQQYGQGIVSSLDPIFLKGSKINGHNYGIPTNKELAASWGFVYRKDIAEKLGILDQVKNMKSIDDLEPILKTVKDKMPDFTPLWLGNGGNLTIAEDWDSMGDSNIPGVIVKSKKDTKVFSQIDSPEYLKDITLTRKLFQEGLIDQDAATSTVGGDQAMKGGKVFMIPESLKPGKAEEVANANGQQGLLDQVTTSDSTVSTSETTGAMLAVASTSANPVKAMQFINLLHTDKTLNNMLNFGIEGTHYTKVSDNIIKATDKTPDYSPGVAWELGNQFLNYIWTTEDPQKWDKFKQFNSTAIPSPALGFTFNADPVKTEVGAIANVIKQYDRSLGTGSVDPAKILPEYQAKLKASGLDKVIAEKQKQLDAFLATQQK
jgi:putative aldouronate transport system substrate-binding protein